MNIENSISKKIIEGNQLDTILKKVGSVNNLESNISNISRKIINKISDFNPTDNTTIENKIEEFESNISSFIPNLSEDFDYPSFYESFLYELKNNIAGTENLLINLGVEKELIPDNILDLLDKVDNEEITFEEAFDGIIKRLDSMEGINTKLVSGNTNNILKGVVESIKEFSDEMDEFIIALNISQLKYEIDNFELKKLLLEIDKYIESFNRNFSKDLSSLRDKVNITLNINFLDNNGDINFNRIENEISSESMEHIIILVEDFNIIFKRIKSELDSFGGFGSISSFNNVRDKIPGYSHLIE